MPLWQISACMQHENCNEIRLRIGLFPDLVGNPYIFSILCYAYFRYVVEIRSFFILGIDVALFTCNYNQF